MHLSAERKVATEGESKVEAMAMRRRVRTDGETKTFAMWSEVR